VICSHQELGEGLDLRQGVQKVLCSLFPATDSVDLQSNMGYNMYQTQHWDEGRYDENYPDDY